MGNVTTTDITDFEGLSAVNNINNNTHKLRDEFDKVLYKDGREEMTGPLDANNQRIYNLPNAANRNEPVTYGQFLDLISGQSALNELVTIELTAQRSEVVATEGQTIFTPSGPYVVGFMAVYVNGVRLSSSEFTATNGTNVSLTSGASAGDIITMESFLGSSVPGDATAITYTSAVTGAVTKTLKTTLDSGMLSVKIFGAVGDGITDDTAAIQNAIDVAGGKTIFFPAGNYAISSILSLKQNVTLLGERGAFFSALATNVSTHMITISGDKAAIKNMGFDGTNVVPPTGRYSSGTYAGTAIYLGGAYADVLIEDCWFSSFPSGAILSYSASSGVSSMVVNRCVFTSMQTYTSAETSAVIHVHAGDICRYNDCTVTNYNWKAFYFANGKYNVMSKCHASGGVTGHASHYLVGGSDNAIVDCSHTGTGFGVKCFQTTRPVVSNFRLESGYSAVYMQGCDDFVINTVVANNPTVKPIIIEGTIGYPTKGTVCNVRATLSVPGTTSNHVGVYISGHGTGTVDGVLIENCYFKNMLWGIQIANSGVAQNDIIIKNNTFINTGQYGILAYLGSGSITGNTFEMDGVSVEAAFYLNRDGVTTNGTVEFSNNILRGCSSDNIQIGEGGRLTYRSVSIKNNIGSGGTKYLDFQGNANAADVVNFLEVSGNEHSGLTTGCTFTFNTTTSTKVKYSGNTFLNSSFARVADTYTNLTNVTFVEFRSQRGSATLSAGTVTVTLPIAEPDNNFFIQMAGNANETFRWSAKGTTGFTITSSNVASTAIVDWSIGR